MLATKRKDKLGSSGSYDTVEKWKEGIEDVREKVEEVVENASDKVEEVMENISDKVDEVVEKIEEVLPKAERVISTMNRRHSYLFNIYCFKTF